MREETNERELELNEERVRDIRGTQKWRRILEKNKTKTKKKQKKTSNRSKQTKSRQTKIKHKTGSSNLKLVLSRSFPYF